MALEGGLVQKTLNLLPELTTASGQEPAGQGDELRLKWVCWRWIQPSGMGEATADKAGMRGTGQMKYGKTGF